MGNGDFSVIGAHMGDVFCDREGDLWRVIAVRNFCRVLGLQVSDDFPLLCEPVAGSNRNQHRQWYGRDGRWAALPDRPMISGRTGKPITNDCRVDLVAKIGG